MTNDELADLENLLKRLSQEHTRYTAVANTPSGQSEDYRNAAADILGDLSVLLAELRDNIREEYADRYEAGQGGKK